MREYIQVPKNLTISMLEKEFGAAVDFYQVRIKERMEAGGFITIR